MSRFSLTCRTTAVGRRSLLACVILFELAVGTFAGADFKLSFLDEMPVLDDTCQLLRQSGFPEDTVATFKKLVEHHNKNGNRVDKSKFPPTESGYYRFHDINDLSNRLPYPFCSTPGNDSYDQQTLMCFDVACLLMKGAGLEAPQAGQDFASKNYVLVNEDNQVAAADYEKYCTDSQLLWPADGYEHFVGKPRSEAENKLALSLRGVRRLNGHVSNSKKDLRAVFSDYLGAIKRDGFKFPKQFKVGLAFWVNLERPYLKPDHAFICTAKGGRLVCVEKVGCKGPYVRTEFESEQDLARYAYWVMNPDFNNPKAKQYSSAVLVSLNDHLIGVFPSAHPPSTNHLASPLPKPTGPFAVGRVDRLMTDVSRDILYRSVTNGCLMTTIWYPAGKVGQRVPGPYINPREMQAWVELFRKYGHHWDAARIARLTNSYAHSFPEAPLSAHPRKFPVVLYVHGHVGLRTDNTGSAEELASHGFIVVSSTHGDTAGMEMPDGTLVVTKPEFHLSGDDTNATAVAVFKDHTKDLQFVLSELERLNASDRMFAGRFDLSRLGVFGWSYGGAAAAEFCNVEPRCQAGLALDPGGHPDLSAVRCKQPFMILTGPDGVTWGARQLFEQLDHNAWFIKIRDAGHDEFGDHAEFFRQSKTGRTQAVVRTCLVSFFTRYLKGKDRHELEASLPNDPQIEVFLKK